MNIIERYVVTVVNYGDTCNGKATVLGTFKSEADAKEYVKNDMDAWYSKYLDEGVSINYDKLNAYFDYNTNEGCEWNIELVKFEV